MTKAAALAELTNIHAQLSSLSGQELFTAFSQIALDRSDCGSFQRNGDLGPFTRGQMQKPFEDGTFALQIGCMSNIIDTDSGLHIIFRSA